MKPKRIKDPMLINSMRGDPCLVCGKPCDGPHHVKSVESGGDDVEDNLAPLCNFGHHQEIHNIGRVSFARKYEKFYDWCIKYDKWQIIDKIEK